MTGHLRKHFKAMHDLFIVMKSRDAPTPNKILMAAGKKPFDDSLQAEYLKVIEEQASGIKEAFAKQQAQAAVRDPATHVVHIFMNIFRSLGIRISLSDC